MSAPLVKADDVELDRLRSVAELETDQGEGWQTPYLPGSAGCHELLDRTNLFGDMIERDLLNHPACLANSEWYRLAEIAVASLRDLYQRIGAEHLSAEES